MICQVPGPSRFISCFLKPEDKLSPSTAIYRLQFTHLHLHPRKSPWRRTIPILPAFCTATAAAAAAAAATDSTSTAAVATVLIRGHGCGQALQLSFTLGDFHCRHWFTPLHLNSKVHLPFAGGREQLLRGVL